MTASDIYSASGKSVYGAPIGILMLETTFPRIPGDMGYAGTWPFPVLYKVVRGATPERVIQRGAAGLLPHFVEAAEELVGMGAEAITTTCGFLSIFQSELAAAVKVPVLTSALMQIPWIETMLPEGRSVGVITISASSLTPAHLAAAKASAKIPIVGVEQGSELFPVLVEGQRSKLDFSAALDDLYSAAKFLVASHPDVGAIVLECANMPPYAARLRDRIGLPVYDVYSMVSWLHAGLRPRCW